MNELFLKLNNDWKEILKDELDKNYFKKIISFLKQEINNWKILYPESDNIFNALNKTSLKNTKVVILWQDPYHWVNQAHWLCFSVQDWIIPPPSLKNIYKEINNDLWIELNTKKWNLEEWTKQWVLLLNAILTVEWWKPASHSKIWWEMFTDTIIKTISDKKTWAIFLLWWAFAQSKKHLINTDKHYVLEASHPSPFSSYRWFFWSKHFSKTNDILRKLGKKEINWRN